ncbi:MULTISPECIES: HU family DNA-binding protein [unclassified Dysgonomonas]|jgi:nucleoid DNA-binding protein|uniref:HU family DNA-binding protein n=1 Tax=unclassified Dysgonomonas TaxID=2630389 RepID=UPI0025BD4539|nr:MULTISPECIES: HU family DNA-binding protein [unclassified Dysgonomonas]MDR2003815.1 HU family DNA-binding protein [Prevotella sp.]HMM03253.1 HU family DNA-binding protein [Dysgonomonas sp.]
MNERLSLQDLIDLLAKKQGIAKKEAETFLRELIAVISESIESYDPVRIKDFGVFKLVKVNARKSVDVNTGEAIEIPAHYKLSFNPDKSLKEAINRPFAHFESVILEDGVSFENMESETEEDIAEEEDDSTDTISIEEEITEYITIPEKSEIKATEANVIAKEIPIPDTEAESAITEAKEEAEINSEEENAGESVSEITRNKTVPVAAAAIPRSSSASTDIESMFYNHRKKSKRRRFISLGFVILLILAAFAIGGYYFQELAAFLTGQPPVDKSKKVVIVFDKKSPADSLAQKQDSTQIQGIAQETKNEPQQETKLPKAEPKNEEVKIAAQPVKDSSKPLATETIRSGHTLRNIALEYYGHKSFWVYIYEENKDVIKNANNIALGTKLIIPAPSKYGIDPKNPASIEKAKQREAKLFKEMGI